MCKITLSSVCGDDQKSGQARIWERKGKGTENLPDFQSFTLMGSLEVKAYSVKHNTHYRVLGKLHKLSRVESGLG